MKNTAFLAVSAICCLLMAGCSGAGGEDVTQSSVLPDPGNSGGGTPPPPAPTPPPVGGSGNIEVSWSPPTQKADGSPLDDLAGYRFYIGEESGRYDEIVVVENPGLSRYSFDNVDSGTYFVAMTSFRANGIESDLSNEVRKSTN
ncbi:MAG: fibronectin type III domain-containing protein [Pseudomonadota bacterium]